jgi:hypothetical protein
MKKITTIMAALAVMLMIGFVVSMPVYAGGESPEQIFDRKLNMVIENSLKQAVSYQFISAKKRVIVKKTKKDDFRKGEDTYCVLGYVEGVTIKKNADGYIPTANIHTKRGEISKNWTAVYWAEIGISSNGKYEGNALLGHSSDKKRFDFLMDEFAKKHKACLEN